LFAGIGDLVKEDRWRFRDASSFLEVVITIASVKGLLPVR